MCQSFPARLTQIICGNTVTLQNDKLHVLQPISMISTSQTGAGVFILLSFNQRFNQSHLVSTIGLVINAPCRTREVNAGHKTRFTHYSTADIGHLCMIL